MSRDRDRSRDALTEAVAYFRDLGVAELHLDFGARPGSQTLRSAAPAGPTAPSNPEDVSRRVSRFASLRAVAEEVAACRRCSLCETRTQTVFADGSAAARIMFVGEAPGADEDAQGLPFVGRAGQLLTKMIEAGMDSRATTSTSRTS